jgi:purine-cytosine permease-like protein
VVLYSVPLILGGVRVFLDKFNGTLYPFYLVGLVVAVVWTINRYGYDGGWFTQKPPHAVVSGPGWLWALTAYMGVFIMMMFTWDYARFGKVADIAFNGKVTFGPVFYFMALIVNALVGIFLVTSIPSKGAVSELSGVLGMVGLMGIVGVALVWVSQTRINTANYYLASTNIENFFARTFKVKLPRVFWAVLVGVVIYVFMLENVFSFLTTATEYQGVLILGWTAIALTYIGWSRVRQVDPETAEWRPGRVPMFNVGGLAGWGIATGIGLTMINVGSDSGWYRTWAPIVTFVVAAAVYAVSLEFARRSWFVMERPNDPRDEVDDVWETRVRCYKCKRSYIAFEMDRDPSHGHDAICASCAQASPHFYRAARAEAQAYSARAIPAHATRDSSFA